jgi:hypothetical protein
MNLKIKEQVKDIDLILRNIDDNIHDFNEIKKQIRKYKKQNKSTLFIIKYILTNKFMFSEQNNKFREIYIDENNSNSSIQYHPSESDEDEDEKGKLTEIENELIHHARLVILFCWYLFVGKYGLHKYQIQMIIENFDLKELTKKDVKDFYIKEFNLNRSIAKNYENYIPIIDISIYSFLFKKEKSPEDTQVKKEEERSPEDIQDLDYFINDMKYYLDYYKIADDSKNKSYIEYAVLHHPLYSFINSALSNIEIQNSLKNDDENIIF